MSEQLLYLSAADVSQCQAMTMARVIDTLEEVFRLHHADQCVIPSKLVLNCFDDDTMGRMNAIAMPGYLGGDDPVGGVKWLSNASLNPVKYNLPRSTSILLLNDAHTMIPFAIVDGTQINAYRTGAATGVAAKYLARPDSRTAGLLGAGVQNRTQLIALKTVLSQLEKVMVYDLDSERSREFCAEMSAYLQIEVVPASSAREAVVGQDVVVTATTARQPVVDGEWLKEGSFYAHIGGYEAAHNVVHGADKIVADDWEKVRDRKSSTLSLMYHAGEFNEERIYANLGQIVAGDLKGRETNTERIYFNATGLAVHDLMIAKQVYNEARERGVGIELPFG